MNIHLIIPFYRSHLYKTIIHNYDSKDVIIHPICYNNEIEIFKDNKYDWVKPEICIKTQETFDCYIKLNHFISSCKKNYDDYYGFTCDDDMYEDEFFDELRTKTSDIVFNSNYRGDKIPNDGGCPHEITPLIISKLEDVRVNNIGLSMFFIKGSIFEKFKDLRFDANYSGGDGRFAENIKTKGTVDFMTCWFVFGNYYQPGRHTDSSKFLKSTWKLPKII